MDNIVFMGIGYNGLVLGTCLAEVGHTVTFYDKDKGDVDVFMSGDLPIHEADLARLMKKYSELGSLSFTTDTQVLGASDVIFICDNVIESMEEQVEHLLLTCGEIAETTRKDCLIAITATVPIGTSERIEQYIREHICSGKYVEVAANPQFFSKGTAIRDTLHAGRIIIGADSSYAEEKLREVYRPFHAPIAVVSRKSAEMVKYATNGLRAISIAYINELANLCELTGADIEEVSTGMSLDERVDKRYLNAGIGYGGLGLTAEINEIMNLANSKGYDLKTLQAALSVNSQQNTLMFEKACRRLTDFRGIKAAVLGLTYKPGTDDVGNAPSIRNIAKLLEKGAHIYAYDPAGIEGFKALYPEGINGNGSITYTDDIMDALYDAEVCFILTEWGKIKITKPDEYRKLMKIPLVYDGRNIYKVEDMKHAGVEYYSVGRG
jgi:UDPglucose 6-dehydrogenase